MEHRIVIRRDGKVTVISGWRAWLLGAAAFTVAFALAALVTFILLGVAVTVGAVLLILIPVAALLTLLAWLFGSPK